MIVVEPSRKLNSEFERSIALNPTFAQRVRLVRAFIGSMNDNQRALLEADENYAGARHLSETELLHDCSLDLIDP